MIVYSIEIKINESVADEWLKWMQKKHIPDVMKTNLFINFKLLQNIQDVCTYTIQYELESMTQLLKYQQFFAKKLQKEHNAKFLNKFRANRTIFVKNPNMRLNDLES